MSAEAQHVGPDPADVAALRDLLDLMGGFSDNDQRARFLLSSNWMRDRGAAAAGRIEHEAAEEDDGDLGTCPYYARYQGLRQLPWFDPEGTCYQRCYDEPECVTCVPPGGWPSVHAALAEVPDGR